MIKLNVLACFIFTTALSTLYLYCPILYVTKPKYRDE